jgi:CBS domain-containing protein
VNQPRLKIVPIHLKEANAYIREHHRHHGPVVGYKYAIAVATEDDVIRGVAIVGRPVARRLDDGMTLEVNRLATDGTPNACSCLYRAAWRVAREMGYERLITYILVTETGTSLKAAGWTCVGEAGGGSWSVPSRPREDKHPTEKKVRWEAGRPERVRI